MKMKTQRFFKFLALTLCFVAASPFFSTCYAQEKREYNNYAELENELKGAYQIQMLGVRTKPIISNDLLEQVKLQQQQTSRVFVYHREHIRIEVLSKDEMANGTLFSQEEMIIYLNEGEY
jgi:hypothetical protein